MPSANKLKIIHTEASPHWGGQEIRIFEEMKWFREQGHEMILVAPDNGTLYKRCKEIGFKVISIYFTKPKTFLNIFRMMQIILSENPDVVATHSSTDSWAGLIAAKTVNTRKRVRYRHVSAEVKKNILNRWQYKSLANLIFTTGECIRMPLIEAFRLDQEKAYVIPTPITPVKNLPRKEDAVRKLQEELNLGKEARFIGQVSVLRSWKGHLLLIEAFENLYDFTELHLILVGEGAMRAIIEERISSSPLKNRIHLLGHREESMKVMKAFDVIILSSLKNEGIPQCILQAMYCGVPVVANKVGGIPEVINSSTGFLVNNLDYNELSFGISKTYGDKNFQSILANNAKDFVLENFTWEILGLKTYMIFTDQH